MVRMMAIERLAEMRFCLHLSETGGGLAIAYEFVSFHTSGVWVRKFRERHSLNPAVPMSHLLKMIVEFEKNIQLLRGSFQGQRSTSEQGPMSESKDLQHIDRRVQACACSCGHIGNWTRLSSCEFVHCHCPLVPTDVGRGLDKLAKTRNWEISGHNHTVLSRE